MHVRLNIAEDAQLREEVRHLIKGQIKVVIKDLIKETVEEYFKGRENDIIRVIVRSILTTPKMYEIYTRESREIIREQTQKLVEERGENYTESWMEQALDKKISSVVGTWVTKKVATMPITVKLGEVKTS